MKPIRRAINLVRKFLIALSRASDVSPTFEERFRNWHDTQVRHPDDHSKLLAAFLADGGRRLTAAAEISNRLAGRHDFSDFPSTIGLRPSTADYEQALSGLRSEGFAILPQRLSPEMVYQLTEDFSAKPMRMVSDESSVNGKYGPLDFHSPMAEKYEVATADVLNSSSAQNLLFDSGILSSHRITSAQLRFWTLPPPGSPSLSAGRATRQRPNSISTSIERDGSKSSTSSPTSTRARVRISSSQDLSRTAQFRQQFFGRGTRASRMKRSLERFQRIHGRRWKGPQEQFCSRTLEAYTKECRFSKGTDWSCSSSTRLTCLVE
jgi:hypothetical protein